MRLKTLATFTLLTVSILATSQAWADDGNNNYHPPINWNGDGGSINSGRHAKPGEPGFNSGRHMKPGEPGFNSGGSRNNNNNNNNNGDGINGGSYW